MFSMAIPKLECSKFKPQNETKWLNLKPITYHAKALNVLKSLHVECLSLNNVYVLETYTYKCICIRNIYILCNMSTLFNPPLEL